MQYQPTVSTPAGIGTPRAPAIRTVYHLEEQPESGWERLEPSLGPTSHPQARRRARELAEEGWELLGVQVKRGVWALRRLRG
jgi:hypothetical protein